MESKQVKYHKWRQIVIGQTQLAKQYDLLIYLHVYFPVYIILKNVSSKNCSY